jgi:hypothetical protein
MSRGGAAFSASPGSKGSYLSFFLGGGEGGSFTAGSSFPLIILDQQQVSLPS